KLASSTRELRSLIGLLQTQAPNAYTGGGITRPAATFRRWASALHRQAGHLCVLEAVAHRGRTVTVTKADEPGAVEDLSVLFETLDIGAEVTKTTDLAGCVRKHGAGAVFRGTSTDLDNPGAVRQARSVHGAAGQKVDRLFGLL